MKTALLLIDFQKAFENPQWGERNNHDAEKNAAALLDHWRANGWPVLYVQHTSIKNTESLFYKNSHGHEFKAGLEPLKDEPVFQKSVNSAFIGTKLKEHLELTEIDTLIVAGLTTPHCVSTSTRMAGNYGFRVFLAEDATAAFELKSLNGKKIPPQVIHETELAILQGEFAEIIRANEIFDRTW